MTILRRLALLPALAALSVFGLLAAPPTALASCALSPPIAEALAEAEIVFVGTVTATAERDLWATVTVEEIWKGPDLPVVVQVKGGQGGNVGTSVDREFRSGVKYLFTPTMLQDGTFSDNACTPTRVWEEALAALRPADARGPIGGTPPEPSGFDVGGLVVPLGVALLVAAALLIVGLAVRGRQSD